MDLAGTRIRLVFAGSALQPVVLGALRHLTATTPGEPDLTIGLWDSESTRVPLPPMPWPASAIRIRGDVEVAGSRASYRPGTAELSLLDTSGRRGLYSTRSAAALPHDSRGSPLLPLFGWHASSRDLHLVHAAAVGDGARAVLLVGRGGSGKSTSALACLVKGLTFLGDDYVLVRLEPRPGVLNLYGSAKLESRRAGVFPELAALRSSVEGRRAPDSSGPEKAVFYVAEHAAGRLVRERPLAAILLPHVTGRPGSAIRPATAREGFSALAPSTVFQLSGSDASRVAALGRLARALPCFHLDLGTDLGSVPAAIESVLGGVGP